MFLGVQSARHLKILNKMENKPNLTNLTFDEATHTYHADGVQMLSVSRLLGVLTKQSLKNTTNERIKEKARVNSEVAIEKGKEFHLAAKIHAQTMFQSTEKGLPLDMKGRENFYGESVVSAVNKIFLFFKERAKDVRGGYFLFCGEAPICDVENALAGTPDVVFVYEGGAVIFDYKTNAQFDPNPFGKFMEPPLDSLPDTSMAGYQMQMNLYAHLVSVWYGVPIESISAHIVHINDAHGAVIYENCITPESRALTVKLLEWKNRNEGFINNSITK